MLNQFWDIAGAQRRIEDYWIVDLIDRVVEVYRDPGADVTAPYGWRYASVERLMPPSVIEPLGVRGARIRVSALLP